MRDIRTDVEVAERSLGREAYLGWRGDGYLMGGGQGKGKAIEEVDVVR